MKLKNMIIITALMALGLSLPAAVFATASPTSGRDYRFFGAPTPSPIYYSQSGIVARPSSAVAVTPDDIGAPGVACVASTPIKPKSSGLSAARKRRMKIQRMKMHGKSLTKHAVRKQTRIKQDDFEDYLEIYEKHYAAYLAAASHRRKARKAARTLAASSVIAPATTPAAAPTPSGWRSALVAWWSR